MSDDLGESSRSPADLSAIQRRLESHFVRADAAKAVDIVKSDRFHFDDEYSNQDAATIDVLHPVVLDTRMQKGMDFTPTIQRHIDYYARTRQLETDTDRVRILQQEVDKMTAGTDIKARVIIMNKGVGQDAFVLPDGSIFISQSLINILSLDEVAGVLAHEVNHIIEKTFMKKVQAESEVQDMAVGYIHEVVSDVKSPALLEKANRNSYALSTAIKKISENDRDEIHQTGLMRASQIVVAHAAVDYATSDKELEPLPEILKGEAAPTNIEMFRSLLSENDTGGIAEAIAKLHPKDLFKVYEERRKWGINRQADEAVSKACNELVYQRVLAKSMLSDYPNATASLFLLAAHNTELPIGDIFIDDPNGIRSIATVAADYVEKGAFGAVYKEIFGVEPSAKIANPEHFFQSLVRHICTPEQYSKLEGVPVTEDTIVDIIQAYDKRAPGKYHEQLVQLMFGYADKSYLTMRKLDIEAANRFFKRVLALGVFTNEDYVKALDRREYSSAVQIGNEIVLTNWSGANKSYPSEFREPAEAAVGEGEFAEIDTLFDDLESLFIPEDQEQKFIDYLKKLRDRFTKQEVPDSVRAAYLNHIADRINSMNFRPAAVDMLLSLGKKDRVVRWGEQTEDMARDNAAIVRYFMKQTAAFMLFSEDKAEYYDFTKRTMEETGFDPVDLTDAQLLNLSMNLLKTNNYSRNINGMMYGYDLRLKTTELDKKVKINNPDQLSQMPFIQEILRRRDDLDIDNLEDLLAYTVRYLAPLTDTVSYPMNEDLFSDNPYSLIAGRNIRPCFEKIIAEGIKPEEFGTLYDFVSKTKLQGETGRRILREANIRYLESAATIEEKTDFIVNNFDSIGFEGMKIVAEQINDLQTYRTFRERVGDRMHEYMGGTDLVQGVAVLDNVSSFLNENFELLLKTSLADDATKAEMSTLLAQKWSAMFLMGSSSLGISYDQATEKVNVNKIGREIFSTVQDVVDGLTHMPESQRFLIVQKMLTDKNGALTSLENRRRLADFVIQSVNLPDGFISSSLRAACETAEGETFSLLISRMMGPLLFRAFDLDRIDTASLMDVRQYGNLPDGPKLSDFITESSLQHLIKSASRDVVRFGQDYKDSHSPLAELADESESQYRTVQASLNNLLDEQDSPAANEAVPLQDAAMESVIKAVESSGALGVRGIQLFRHLRRTDPELDARLARCFDSNAGLEKLRFWENILVHMDRDPHFADFMETNNVTIDERRPLGGGSLYTTYAATMVENGNPGQIVLKLLNPNAASFVRKGFKIAETALHEVINNNSDPSSAELALMLVELSHNWCLADINDPSYEADDDLFHTVVQAANARFGDTAFSVPERVFTNQWVKAERRAKGETVNRMLGTNTVDPAEKQSMATRLGDLFEFQLSQPTAKDESGADMYLVHSDPHPGNYIFDPESGTTRVIDRHMYLKLTATEAQAYKSLYHDEKLKFLAQFVDAVLDHNKVRGVITRNAKKLAVMQKMMTEYLKNRSNPDYTSAVAFQNLTGELTSRGLTIPLHQVLMGRNAVGMRTLVDEYSQSSLQH